MLLLTNHHQPQRQPGTAKGICGVFGSDGAHAYVSCCRANLNSARFPLSAPPPHFCFLAFVLSRFRVSLQSITLLDAATHVNIQHTHTHTHTQRRNTYTHPAHKHTRKYCGGKSVMWQQKENTCGTNDNNAACTSHTVQQGSMYTRERVDLTCSAENHRWLQSLLQSHRGFFVAGA